DLAGRPRRDARQPVRQGPVRVRARPGPGQAATAAAASRGRLTVPVGTIGPIRRLGGGGQAVAREDAAPRWRRSAVSDSQAADRGPSLVDSAEEALHTWLAGGRYRQGDRLPPEHEVATMPGVSRGTLRSALHRLEERGEIVRRQGSGTFVGRSAVPAALGERLERLEPYS